MDDSLSYEALFEGAKKFALSAWSAHNQDTSHFEIFLLHAGVSIERLAKAALARQSPVLLMETNAKEDLLLFFAGAISSVEKGRIRTVSASGAIARLRKLAVLQQKDTALDDLIELRNGVAHLSASVAEDFDPAATFARTTVELLGYLQEDPLEYWGRMAPLADVVLSKSRSEIERRVSLQIASARHRFEERFDGLQADAMDTYRASATTVGPALHQAGDEAYLSQSHRCPACASPASVDAKLVLNHEPSEEILFEVVALGCEHCHLILEGREELEAADVEFRFDLPSGSMLRRHLYWDLVQNGKHDAWRLHLTSRIFGRSPD
ncbi:hypothetical protein [Streptomyces sp. NPDC021020]|uniref:hypothetical protein n=1 Tax=Streptomyces sp. NPDC021020 TaxID=3365109 RepID=UPI0037AEF60E